ncbi:MAG: SMP-30/gluconolactonase/LRE family protein, partial [Dehalococcoidia bacterium]
GSRILRHDPRSGETTDFRRYTNRTNGLAFSADGQLYGCQGGSRRIVRFNADGSTSLLEYRLDGHFHNHPNDLAIDEQGRIWFTDPYGRLPAPGPQLQGPLDHASVLRLERRVDRTWTIRRMTYDTTSPNGILVSQDQRTLYVAESDYGEDKRRELRAYPIREDGTLGPYTVLHTFGIDQRGVHRGVDGMCLDTEGNIIVCAGWERSGPGPMIYVFSPSGQVLETHPVPVDRPTNCTFGDADLRTLYVTTGEGHLFRVRNTGRQGWLLFPPP